jgi:hypothetical protein
MRRKLQASRKMFFFPEDFSFCKPVFHIYSKHLFTYQHFNKVVNKSYIYITTLFHPSLVEYLLSWLTNHSFVTLSSLNHKCESCKLVSHLLISSDHLYRILGDSALFRGLSFPSGFAFYKNAPPHTPLTKKINNYF